MHALCLAEYASGKSRLAEQQHAALQFALAVANQTDFRDLVSLAYYWLLAWK